MKQAALPFMCWFLVACHGAPEGGTEAGGEQQAAISTVAVRRVTVEETVTTFGKVEFATDRQRTLTFLKAGQVTRVSVVAGQAVKKGDLLLSVGGVPRGAPEMQQALIDVDYATREVARVERLAAEKLATNQDLEAARKALSAAEAKVRGLGGGGPGGPALRADSDGIVAEVLVRRGDLVQAGQAGVILADRDAMTVRAGFEVEDLPKLHEGTPIRVSPVFGETTMRLDAELSTLERSVNATTQLVEGLIQLKEPPSWIAAGLAVHVVAVLESHHDVLGVPPDAIVRQGGKPGVFAVEDGRAHFRPLELGIAGEDAVEVTRGLNEGAQVATTGRTSLSDGMAVRVSGSKP